VKPEGWLLERPMVPAVVASVVSVRTEPTGGGESAAQFAGLRRAPQGSKLWRSSGALAMEASLTVSRFPSRTRVEEPRWSLRFH